MSMVPVAGFLRGLLPGLGWSSSRLPEAVTKVLPADSVEAARVPVAVHMALRGSASRVLLAFERRELLVRASPTTTRDFVAVVNGVVVRTPLPEPGGATSTVSSIETIEIGLPVRPDDETVRIYLPEHRGLRLMSIGPVGGTIEPAPEPPVRWVAYGDSITHGWTVAHPESSWARRTADRFGLELVNLGLAGSARGELPAAIAIAESGADLVTIAWGTNAWSTIPTDAAQLRQTMRVFLTIVRQGLPDAPVVVVSPVVRPDAERAPNRLGATLADLRASLEAATDEFARRDRGAGVTLVPGLELLSADELVDGVHPGEEGHGTMAERIAPYLEPVLSWLPATVHATVRL